MNQAPAPARPREAYEPWKRLTIGWLCLAIGVFVAALALDGPIARAARLLPRWLLPISRGVTELGLSFYPLVATAAIAAAAILIARRRSMQRLRLGFDVIAQRAVFVFAAVALSGIAAQILKHTLARARPKLIDTDGPYHFDFFAIQASRASFPSGHATTAFAAATAIGLIWPRGRPWLFALASLIGLSRILLGAHYPSDVLAGAALGAVTAMLLAQFLTRRRIAFRSAAGGIVPRGAAAVGAALRDLRAAVGRRLAAWR